ncbi:carbon storage regulator CsrA [Clostridium uliginosum]|uniref:Translational regulator CsrA n=1 Tax=Clostridium uliginosum TaxID=119641 RepID=A0A1I1KI64_9CLOT|nr:carbon storage regulator CsrA [Clostridium uliginosum]SFC60546.1 carbon storage regulator [Clostridium uliginosum]
MLIITRKKGESLMIGDDIEITIAKLDDGSVKLGINAPKDITILRKELYEEVKQENKEAMKINMDLLKNIKKK